MSNIEPGAKIYTDRFLRCARAIRGINQPSAKELLAARHMAWSGATYAEIGTFLKWEFPEATIRRRLRKFNIVRRVKHSHRGDEMTLPYSGSIDFRDYRPSGIPRVR